jgi:hypothetical protein
MPPATFRDAALKERAASIAISAGIGLLLLTAHPVALALTCIVPGLWLRQPDRLSAYMCACSYYAAAIWPVVPISNRFNQGSWIWGISIWEAAVLILSVPWLIFHSADRSQATWCGIGATITSVVPPLGFIGVACPLSAAGLVFPGFKIPGLVLAATLPGLLAWRPKSTVPLAVLLITVAHVSQAKELKHPWIGVDLVSASDPSMIGDFERIQFVLDRAAAEPGKTVVFPEATVRSWTLTTFEFFAESLNSIRAHGTTVLLGVLVPEASDESRTPAYRNAVLKIGSSIEIMDQRVPVPFGMWKPFGRGGVPLHAFGDGIVNSGAERSAVLICYEQLIAWPAVVSTFSSPSLAVGVSNSYWVGGTPIPRLQIAYLKAWAKLWHTPVTIATAQR